MATKTKDIWQTIYEALTAAKEERAGSLSFVKEILQGVREDIPLLPCIIIEPISETENNYAIPNYYDITFRLTITCWLEVYGIDTQITGEEESEIGILDFVAKVKNVLNSSTVLDNLKQSEGIKISFVSTRYIFETYPYRAAEITVDVRFTSKADSR